MNQIHIKMFEAHNGDAFLLTFDNGQNIVIDMGLEETYEANIKSELIKLNNEKKKIDLLVITHTDNDHIGGAIEFLKDNENNKIISIDEIWHNSYKHLQFNKSKVDQIQNSFTSILKSIVLENCSKNTHDSLQNISFKQGSSFASLIYKSNYNWNTSFDGKAVCTNTTLVQISKSDINIILLSPNEKKLTHLSTKWLNELKKRQYQFEISNEEIFDDAFEFYMKYEQGNSIKLDDISSTTKYEFEKIAEYEEKDSSVTNGASISFILEYKNKKLLFLADSHEDIIYENLSLLGQNGYDLTFDLVKLPHHGSNKNISNRLIKLIKSEMFLISTNGAKHLHPDIEAISKIIINHPNLMKKLIFNYKLGHLNTLNDNVHKKTYNYEILQMNEVII